MFIDEIITEATSNPRIPRKKGQPANSKKHSDLYTDENPRGTIHGLKFATVSSARASVSKIRNSGKSHAHKIQAAVAMEQRARAAGKTSAAAVYRKFINGMKKKTKESVDITPVRELIEACWKGYHKEGNKKMFGKTYPNCVKNKKRTESTELVCEPINESMLLEQVDYCLHCGNLILPEASGNLHKWFKDKWVNIGKKVKGKHPPCGTSGSKRGYAKCVPAAKARRMSAAQKKSAVTRKRKAQSAAGRAGKDSGGSGKKPIYVSTSPKK